MDRATQRLVMGAAAMSPLGQVIWTTPGTYSWTVPEGVYAISAVVIGAGSSGGSSATKSPWSTGYGGGGGALRYAISIPVTPGEVLTIFVGARGTAPELDFAAGVAGGSTSIRRGSQVLLIANGGSWATAATGTAFSDNVGGGNGSTGAQSGAGTTSSAPGGASAAGYSSDGVKGMAPTTTVNAQAANGAGGSGGAGAARTVRGGKGGGTGLYGAGANGVGGLSNSTQAAADGTAGSVGTACGGAGGGGAYGYYGADGQDGGARIIWGEGRAYPSTRTADEF